MEKFDAKAFVERQIKEILDTVGEKRVLLGLSGGVDSSVCAALLSKAIGNQLTCVLVDHGLMRKDEVAAVRAAFADFELELVVVDAKARFLDKLSGVTDPERKRKIIGEEFIRVFEEQARIVKADLLAQGTIYPDISESASLKSHHNVGGLPDDIAFCSIIEPLCELYKPEVRQVGYELGLPGCLIERQPFPGPGLGVRCVGEVTAKKLDVVRESDSIFRDETEKYTAAQSGGLNSDALGQYFAAVSDTLAVGVRDGERVYGYVVMLRAVRTVDFVNADVVHLPWELLERVSARICNEVAGVARVVYDVTAKPPGTIEFE